MEKQDVEQTYEEGRSKLREAAGQLQAQGRERWRQVRRRSSAMWNRTRDTGTDAWREARAQGVEIWEDVQELIQKHPGKIVTAAVALGALFGGLLSRRKD